MKSWTALLQLLATLINNIHNPLQLVSPSVTPSLHYKGLKVGWNERPRPQTGWGVCHVDITSKWARKFTQIDGYSNILHNKLKLHTADIRQEQHKRLVKHWYQCMMECVLTAWKVGQNYIPLSVPSHFLKVWWKILSTGTNVSICVELRLDNTR